jgi:hypothetical protein
MFLSCSMIRTCVPSLQVALLERNIVIQGNSEWEKTGRGAVIRIHQGGSARVRDVKIHRAGQSGRLGAYPFHWHMLGKKDGDFFSNSVVIKSSNKCVAALAAG